MLALKSLFEVHNKDFADVGLDGSWMGCSEAICLHTGGAAQIHAGALPHRGQSGKEGRANSHFIIYFPNKMGNFLWVRECDEYLLNSIFSDVHQREK